MYVCIHIYLHTHRKGERERERVLPFIKENREYEKLYMHLLISPKKKKKGTIILMFKDLVTSEERQYRKGVERMED